MSPSSSPLGSPSAGSTPPTSTRRGWQAHAKRPDETVLEISIYHNPDEAPAAEDDWALMVRSLRKERLLGIIPSFQETEVDSEVIATLDDVFEDARIVLLRTPSA
jgi:hypothetical protein